MLRIEEGWICAVVYIGIKLDNSKILLWSFARNRTRFILLLSSTASLLFSFTWTNASFDLNARHLGLVVMRHLIRMLDVLIYE